MKKSILAASVAVAGLALTACGEPPAETTETDAAGTSSVVPCMVSDAGGFDDKSFNETSYLGMTNAVEEFGLDSHEAESASATDFTPNVESMVDQGCTLVIGVGFALEDAIQAGAEANEDVNFALVDSAFNDADFNPVTYDNAKPLLFNTQEAAYLAGYVAAGTTKTGTVATFGGMQFPSVTIFMDGFADGVARYNEDNGTSVQVLGWDKAAQTGQFAGNFDNQADGQNIANSFIASGADVIMPVAGPVGLGAAAAAKEAGNVYIIGVDSDWYEFAPEYGDITLTSVVKKMDEAVFATIEADVNGEFTSESYVGNLENGGVDIAPFHDLESEVPAEVAAKVEELKAQIISGELVVESVSSNKAE